MHDEYLRKSIALRARRQSFHLPRAIRELTRDAGRACVEPPPGRKSALVPLFWNEPMSYAYITMVMRKCKTHPTNGDGYFAARRPARAMISAFAADSAPISLRKSSPGRYRGSMLSRAAMVLYAGLAAAS